MKVFYNHGLSFVEILLVISIFLILAASSIPLSAGFFTRNQFVSTRNELISALRTAQQNSMAAKGNQNWGVWIDASQIVLYQGANYVSRNAVFDQVYQIPADTTVTGNELNFAKVNGNLSQAKTIILQNKGGETTTLNINLFGVVDVIDS